MKVFFFPVSLVVVQLLSVVFTQQASQLAPHSAAYTNYFQRGCLERSSAAVIPLDTSGSLTGLRGPISKLLSLSTDILERFEDVQYHLTLLIPCHLFYFLSTAYLETTNRPTGRATTTPSIDLTSSVTSSETSSATSQPSCRPTARKSSSNFKFNIFNRNLGIIVGIVVVGIFVIVLIRKLYKDCWVAKRTST